MPLLSYCVCCAILKRVYILLLKYCSMDNDAGLSGFCCFSMPIEIFIVAEKSSRKISCVTWQFSSISDVSVYKRIPVQILICVCFSDLYYKLFIYLFVQAISKTNCHMYVRFCESAGTAGGTLCVFSSRGPICSQASFCDYHKCI